MSNFVRLAPIVGAAAVLLAACGALPFGSAQGRPAQDEMQPAIGALRPLPDAKSDDLMYVLFAKATRLHFFSFPRGKHVGTIKGLSDPGGLCTDRAGNVFVTDAGTQHIVEYQQGGSTPIRRIRDNGYGPNGCAINPRNGDLAVANYCAGAREVSGECAGGHPVAVTVFKRAGGAPHVYSNAAFEHFFFCGYDPHGNLFVDGLGNSGKHLLGELSDGGAKLKVIRVKGMGYPGGVQWDGKYITVGNYQAGIINRYVIVGSVGVIVGSTTLDGGAGTLQYWIGHGAVFGATNIYSKGHILTSWKYPAGGAATKTYHIAHYNQLIGTVVSEGGT